MTLQLNRRGMLCSLASAAVAGVTRTTAAPAPAAAAPSSAMAMDDPAFMAGLQGSSVDPKLNGFDPQAMLRDFDGGKTRRLPGGRVLREWEIAAGDKTITLADGVTFPAWTYNDRVPGPTLRATQGDLLRIHFVNATEHPHSMHFHGIHPAAVDGVPGNGPAVIAPGGRTTYEFEATPFGMHLYHCHAFPLAVHVARGLYGAFIIDPPGGRPPADELVMVMNAFDTDADGNNELYAVNTIPFAYMSDPVRVRRGELVRIHVANLVEYDPVNSFHVHANLFDYFPTGTSLVPSEYTDTVLQCQGQRGIVELRFPYPGSYMFHAHQSEFTELGWMGRFEVS
ncbi:MAG: multicopper oxidase type 3 [Solirubrobacteraceae bacterium]|nr:multicopper oxidase type 3 [Solirubrobacteraceae bacterium]